jgi:hypothetical protein
LRPSISAFLALVMLADVAFGCCGPACALTRKVQTGKALPPEQEHQPPFAERCANPCCQHRSPPARHAAVPTERESPPPAPCPCCHRDATFLIAPSPAEGVGIDLGAGPAPLAADHLALLPLARSTPAFDGRERPGWLLSGRDVLRAYHILRC